MKFQEYKDEKNWLKDIEKNIEDLINSTKKVPSICICGGQTIVPILESIQKKFHTNKINFYLSDERYVDLDDYRSNYHLITQYLTSENFMIYHFDTSLSKLQCIKTYEKIIKPIRFDIAILSIGPDGHIASIFPRSRAIKSNQSTEPTTTSKFEVKNRLTLTIKKLKNTKNIILLAKNRHEIVKKIINKDPANPSLPAKFVYSLKNTKFFWAKT